jgi:chemotaxis protein MotB
MARRKRHGGHENHERWLVSYADFITLLFAFFVVMFASSQADKGKAAQVSESIQRALSEKEFASAVAGILGGAPGNKQRGNVQMKGPGGTEKIRDKPEEALLPSMHLLQETLRREIDAGMLQVSLEQRGLIISLRQAAFFPSGEDTVDPSTFATLGRVAQIVGKLPNKVRLEGHTDSVPIHNQKFRSNWDLSSARSVAMLDLMTAHYGLPPSRFSVAGYADTVPIEANDTDAGRSRNRRVDIVILNEFGVHGEPGANRE